MATTMPQACVACTKRKVRCDKSIPICSTCQKKGLDCVYEAPRRRKRRLSNEDNDLIETLARYERILRQHGLLDSEKLPKHPAAPPSLVSTTIPVNTSVSSKILESNINNNSSLVQEMTGKLLVGPGTSRYVSDSHWDDLGEEEMRHISNDINHGENEEEEEAENGLHATNTSNVRQSDHMGLPAIDSQLLTSPLLGFQQTQSLLRYHPTPYEAMQLVDTHVRNVEPICKILHIPSTYDMVHSVVHYPERMSKIEECLLFAIYHFAVFSMTDEECTKMLGQPRNTVLENYHFAARQALVNVSFLQTTSMTVLQALVLLLISSRHHYDPHTYWILTGVAVRIGQRMGLHKDGEKLGLPPFEVQMRRRLFFQLIPLDGLASKMSGTGIVSLSMQGTSDTMRPLNVNDDQIWPGMTETPEERSGATEMSFCLLRMTVARFIMKTSGMLRDAEDFAAIEEFISKAEDEVEEKFIRYCDMINPLHILVSLLARSAITAMRLRSRLPKVRDQSITTEEGRELIVFSQRILDTDTTAHAHTSIRKFSWHTRPFFIFGTWDSLIFVLTNLRNPDKLQLSRYEIEMAWSRIEQIYNNHDELLEPKKQALHIAVGRLTLKAWDIKPVAHGTATPDPDFICALRSLRDADRNSRVGKQKEADVTPASNDASLQHPSTLSDSNLDIGADFNFDAVDWEFWDQLIMDYQAQGS